MLKESFLAAGARTYFPNQEKGKEHQPIPLTNHYVSYILYTNPDDEDFNIEKLNILGLMGGHYKKVWG